jgi:hypothetical protein
MVKNIGYQTIDGRISSMIKKRDAYDSLFLATMVAGLIDAPWNEKDSFIMALYLEEEKGYEK